MSVGNGSKILITCDWIVFILWLLSVWNVILFFFTTYSIDIELPFKNNVFQKKPSILV